MLVLNSTVMDVSPILSRSTAKASAMRTRYIIQWFALLC